MKKGERYIIITEFEIFNLTDIIIFTVNKIFMTVVWTKHEMIEFIKPTRPLFHNDKFITNFKQKAKIFNNFFAKKCSRINTNSDLHSVLSKKAHKLLSTIHFKSDDILKIIKNFDPNKALGLDTISIRIMKICDASVFKPLETIFRSCLENGKFPTELKKPNVVPANTKKI